MIFRLLTISICLLISQVGTANKYILDQLNLEAQFEAATDITDAATAFFNEFNKGGFKEDAPPSYETAGALAIIEAAVPARLYFGWFFITAATAGIGIVLLPGVALLASIIGTPYHRFYLGTGDNRFSISALYCITFNGLGLINIADAFALFIADEDHDSYIDNPKFLMWIDDLEGWDN
jgi:hypothetical protein